MPNEDRPKDPAAVEMSRKGSSKGGKSRAQALTPEARSEIASIAASARWAKHRDQDGAARVTAHATHASVLRLGAAEIPCFVLEDGRRVLSQTAMVNSLGMSPSGATARPGQASHRMAVFVGSESLDAFVPNDLAHRIDEPIRFLSPRATPAYGYEATILADVCDVILAARRAGTLKPNQQHVADRAETLVRAFARVGIVALVDEATGYQERRDREELQRILAAYMAPELAGWTKRFPDEFYRQLFRLHGWAYTVASCKRPALVAQLTNQLVYEKLPRGVLEELKRRNPADDKGRRRHRHRQFLSEGVGHPHLQQHLYAVTALMRGSPDWGTFHRWFLRAFPPYTAPLSLLPDPEPAEEAPQEAAR